MMPILGKDETDLADQNTARVRNGYTVTPTGFATFACLCPDTQTRFETTYRESGVICRFFVC